MRTTPLILALTLVLGACGRPIETGDTGCDTGCTDTDTAVDTGCDGCVDPNDPDGDGVTQDDGDCAPTDATVFPGAPELLDTIDNDCDTIIDEGTVAFDDDNDSYTEEEGDCDDNQPAVNPMATDLVGDAIDQNCDGADGFDGDGDGHASPVSGGDDCDDIDPITFPGAVEVWYDGIDQTCSGSGWLGDSDQDGDGIDSEFVGGADCVDTNALVNPRGVDMFDGLDDNCNGMIDGFSLVVEWTTDPILTVTATDIGPNGGEFVVVDSFGGFAFVSVDEGEPGSENLSSGITSPAANQTYMFQTQSAQEGQQTCWAWGYDTSQWPDCIPVDATTL